MIIQGKRAVVFFDILGFKNMITNSSLSSLAEKYEKIVSNTEGEASIDDSGVITRKQVCHRFIFSDSIFLIAEEDSVDSFIDLVSYSWRMMQFFIAAGFPLRGAITYGDLYANFEKNIFLGKAISDAAVLEGKQNWIGAIADDSAVDRYAEAFEGDTVQAAVMNSLLPKYLAVPFKDGTERSYRVINWRQNMISEDGIKALFKNEPFDANAQIKIDNVLRFSKEVVNTGYAYFMDENVPQRYRRLYVGHKTPTKDDPMFRNGDEY